jgi:hypothetical protein
VKKLTEPEVKTRSGRIIEPIKLEKRTQPQAANTSEGGKKDNRANKKQKVSH